jgi:hypothetical protein
VTVRRAATSEEDVRGVTARVTAASQRDVEEEYESLVAAAGREDDVVRMAENLYEASEAHHLVSRVTR